MPRSSSPESAEVLPGTSLALPPDVRADLLRAQQESIETPQRLPLIKVLGQGVGLFEFADTNDTARSFSAVILNSHPTNVLWDKAYGDAPATDDEKMPACSSRDGKWGVPRQGFIHVSLGVPAVGTEMIECRTCPYNQFGSGNLLLPERNQRGKAVGNYRSIYVMLNDRQAPMELRIPATSVVGFDEYLTMLTNRGIPAQGIVTKISQVVEMKGQFRVGVVKFEIESTLTLEMFSMIMAKREQFANAIFPNPPVAVPPIDVHDDMVRDQDYEEMPF